MNILLVEDEKITRLGIRKTIEKERDFLIVAECSNGKQALEQVKLHPEIDIVLLDLNMPIMNGLEFLDHLDPSFLGQVIVLSSYDDLENIKEAMKKGASDYFHKPTMSPKKIINILKEAKNKQKNKSNPDTKEWIKQLIYHPSEQLLINQTHWLGSRQIGKVVILMGVNDFIKTKLTNFVLIKILTKWKELNNFQGEFISYKDGQFVFFEQLSTNSLLHQYNHLKSLCGSLSRYLNEVKEVSVSFGISQSIHDPMKLKACIQEAELSLEAEFFNGRGTLQFYKKEDTVPKKSLPKSTQIWTSFENYNQESLQKELKEYFNSLKKFRDQDQVITLAINLKMELKRRMEKYKKEDLISPKSVVYLKYFSDVEKDVSENFQKVLEWLIEFENKQFSPMIRHVLKYLTDNFNSDLSLDTLAKNVQTNPSYLSRVFKEQTGYKISDYITNLRMEKAKDLLLDQHLRAKDVALAVGYANERYFSQLFRKHSGMSPTEYKKQK